MWTILRDNVSLHDNTLWQFLSRNDCHGADDFCIKWHVEGKLYIILLISTCDKRRCCKYAYCRAVPQKPYYIPKIQQTVMELILNKNTHQIWTIKFAVQAKRDAEWSSGFVFWTAHIRWNVKTTMIIWIKPKYCLAWAKTNSLSRSDNLCGTSGYCTPEQQKLWTDSKHLWNVKKKLLIQKYGQKK